MTRSEFSEGFDILVNTFSVLKPKEKADAYFRFLEKIPGKAFTDIVQTWVKTQPRFPTISDLFQAYGKFVKPQEKRSCADCDGFGRIKHGYKIYRSWCEHGEFASKNIKLLKPFMLESELMSQRVELSELYGEDLAKRRHPELFK